MNENNDITKNEMESSNNPEYLLEIAFPSLEDLSRDSHVEFFSRLQRELSQDQEISKSIVCEIAKKETRVEDEKIFPGGGARNEQHKGDEFGVAKVLYELVCTGQIPFEAASVILVLRIAFGYLMKRDQALHAKIKVVDRGRKSIEIEIHGEAVRRLESTIKELFRKNN